MPSGIPTLAASRRQLARHPKRVKKQGMSRLVCYLSQAIAAHDPGKQSSLEDGLWAVAYPTWSDAPGRGMLRDAGVLDCLVDILRAEQGTFSGLAVQRAAQAVEQFVRLDWAASCRLFDLGIIRRLVDLLDLGPNQIATEAAIRTLHMYAAQMHSIKDLIVASGAVKVLVKLMQDAFVAHNYLILKEVAWVFICLADTDELCKDALREGGAIEQLDQAIAHSSGGHLYRGTSLPSDAVAEEGPRDDEDDLCIDVDYFCRRSQRRDWSAASTEMLVRVLGAGPCLLEARKEAAGALRALAAGNKLAKEFSMHAGVLQNVMQLLMSSAGGQGTGSGQRSLAWEAAEILSVLTDDNPDQQAAISKAGVVQGLVTVLKGLLEDPAASRTSMPLPSSTTPKALASIRVAAEPASPATAATPGSSSAAVHAAASPATPTRVGPSLPLHIHNTPGPPGSPACPIKRTDAEASDQDVTLSDHASPAQIPVIQEPQEDPADLPNSSHLGAEAGSRGLARTQSEQLRSPTKRQISMLSALKEAPIKDARPAVQRPLGLIKAAASTLLNLVDHSSANQDTVRSLGGLTLATDLLRLALDLGLERGLVAVAAGLVRALADGSPANQSALGEAGTVALLLEVLKAAAQSSSSEATAAKHRAIWALQSLVDESPMNQAALREAGGLQLLVEQLALRAQAGAGPVIEEDLQAYYAEDPGRLAADVESATAASWALGTAVAEDRASQDLLRDVGGMLPLLTLLRDCREGKARMGVLWALGNLVKGNPACQAAVMHNDGIILLVSLFEKGPLAREAEGAAWTLHNVVEGNPRCKEAAREAGAIPALVRLLGGGPDSVVTECAARTLHALAEDNPLNQDEICVAGSLEPLVMILGSGSDKLGAKSAALAIGSLVKRHPINQNAVRRAGGVGFLVNLLRAGPMNRAAVYAAHAIGHLVAENRINQDAVHDAGGVELMVRLLKGGLGLGIETRTSLAATRAIAALTDGHPSNKAAAMAAGAGEALAQCLARMALVSGDLAAHLVLLETAAHACTAIANLSSGSPPAQDAFRTMGCAELLVRLLAGPSMMVVQEASRGLASLAAGCPSNQAAVANAGGVEFLVGVLQHQTQDDAESMQAAASILHAILVATNPANHEVRKRAVDPAGPPDPSDTEEAQAEATANGMLGNGLSSDPHRFAESGAAADRGEPEKPLHDAGFAFVAMFLQEGSTRAVKEQAASALFQLAQGNPANRRAIYELAAAGVIPLAEQLVHFQDRLRSAASNKPSILHLLANCGQAFGGFAA
ncbi:hypothetical protein WJX72_003008 [[Myrmecia] bisecta]|uniref:Uncharacterized protein n=1 Tax=[Myrmecia] bisecta TaxID=41462 RepID=A0AAW1QEK2_9CHLO